jgi:hypothetical protein
MDGWMDGVRVEFFFGWLIDIDTEISTSVGGRVESCRCWNLVLVSIVYISLFSPDLVPSLCITENGNVNGNVNVTVDGRVNASVNVMSLWMVG